jgi:anthranilate synthase/aminodeoxychorismate synthase-like glutamine amidotransferase
MILVIDNYDSFTYNLVQYVGSFGQKVVVRRNDRIDIEEIEDISPRRIIISPGPGYPVHAGISKKTVIRFMKEIPILGVCLGHQCIAEALDARIVPAKELVHGKSSEIHHDGKGIYNNIASPFQAGRYHSLEVDRDSLPDSLEISAFTADDQIMGIRHRRYPLDGVQFHPESILTETGMEIIENFLRL